MLSSIFIILKMSYYSDIKQQKLIIFLKLNTFEAEFEKSS